MIKSCLRRHSFQRFGNFLRHWIHPPQIEDAAAHHPINGPYPEFSTEHEIRQGTYTGLSKAAHDPQELQRRKIRHVARL
jgi:hypothetical protein